jgi:1-acyl-sn-glycerol-3-phosphate acyltransferase
MKEFIFVNVIKIIFAIYIQFVFIFSLYIGYITNDVKTSIKNYYNELTDLLTIMYKYLFNTKLKISGEYNKTDKVDIIIANHIDVIDIMMMISLLKIIDSRPFYFIGEKISLDKLGGFTALYYYSDNILIHKNIDKDKQLIKKLIDKINTGIIIIYPEGLVFKEDTIKKSLEYCKTNNLIPFNNLLYPKTQGLWHIINELKNQNKLGNLIDVTFILSKIKDRNEIIKDLVTSNKILKPEDYKIGDTNYIIRSFELNKYVDNYNNFKEFLLKVWREKDIILEGSNYKTYKFNEITYNRITFIKTILLVLIICIINFILIKKTSGFILLPYLILIVYYNKKVIDSIS